MKQKGWEEVQEEKKRVKEEEKYRVEGRAETLTTCAPTFEPCMASHC